mmetsp:Transcript_109029/g.339799  ORF Transcript_109029/g.339799 Transcript_109029/m.339799 type:complete len:150 (-) Transcript_109029:90-539(-)
MGVLDEGSAEFLGKLPEEAVKDILSSLGPEVRNPSAFVTRKAKAVLQSESPARFGESSAYDGGSRGMHSYDEDPRSVSIYFSGSRTSVAWHSQQQALDELVSRGILDQRSSDFLAKLPERAARDIVASLGPDVRNPSAFVTKEARKWQN